MLSEVAGGESGTKTRLVLWDIFLILIFKRSNICMEILRLDFWIPMGPANYHNNILAWYIMLENEYNFLLLFISFVILLSSPLSLFLVVLSSSFHFIFFLRLFYYFFIYNTFLPFLKHSIPYFLTFLGSYLVSTFDSIIVTEQNFHVIFF